MKSRTRAPWVDRHTHARHGRYQALAVPLLPELVISIECVHRVNPILMPFGGKRGRGEGGKCGGGGGARSNHIDQRVKIMRLNY